MAPNWLIALVLTLIATWKIKRVLRYRDNDNLFIKEITSNDWIDKSKLKDAIRYYIYREALFYIALPIFAVISYVRPLAPYLWPIAISILVSYSLGFIWWDRKFSAKKPKS